MSLPTTMLMMTQLFFNSMPISEWRCSLFRYCCEANVTRMTNWRDGIRDPKPSLLVLTQLHCDVLEEDENEIEMPFEFLP